MLLLGFSGMYYLHNEILSCASRLVLSHDTCSGTSEVLRECMFMYLVLCILYYLR